MAFPQRPTDFPADQRWQAYETDIQSRDAIFWRDCGCVTAGPIVYYFDNHPSGPTTAEWEKDMAKAFGRNRARWPKTQQISEQTSASL